MDCDTIPHQTYMIFQMMFAIITPALIVAALAERMKFSAFIIFIVLWATFVYDFAAHWTWEITAADNYGANPGYCGFGWTGCLGSLDFAGGTVIHITSGWSGLVIALMLGRRLGYGKIPMEPHNIGMVVLGAALLWTGWFGFNAGSAAAAATNATSAFVATQIATGTASSNLGINIMGSYRKTIYCGCSIWCCSWPSSHYACLWICIANVFTYHWYNSFACLLCGSNVQEQTQMG